MVIEKDCGDGQFNCTKSIDFSTVLNKSNDEIGISGKLIVKLYGRKVF